MKKVTVTRSVGESTEIREMSEIQWKNIGDNPQANGGWKVSAPKEATMSANTGGGDSDELITARARFEELTGEKAGNRKLETLQAAIAGKEAELDKQGE